ncbi:hypothetical protein [Sedimentibacter sp.]|uniref:hypothetical protein n=1 Tax=Sedimentibacter sp. TaxID=1960295 RepID=UPI0028B12ADE|nr:hypothetical protein [Sedimentibacter sp.]
MIFISKKIWNAQIPVAIFCGTSTIKIFNGCTLEQGTNLLAETIIFHEFNEIDENSSFSLWEITDHSFWERAIRKYWMVESFHWHLDVTFREDSNRTFEK